MKNLYSKDFYNNKDLEDFVNQYGIVNDIVAIVRPDLQWKYVLFYKYNYELK